jgi:predicted esterase
MKRSAHCLFLIFLLTVAARAQSVEGAWEGILKISSGDVRLVLHITRDGQGGFKGFIDARGGLFPATAITFSGSTLKFDVQQNGGSYEGKVNAEGTAISGTWTQRSGSSPQLDFRRVQAGAVAPETAFLKRAVTVGKNTYGYRIHLPEGFDAKKSYPVVLYLHGAGSGGNDNEKQTFVGLGAAIRRNPKQFDSLIAVLPQIPERSFWGGEMVEQAIKALEQTITEFKADPQRLYLMGNSMGGYGVWYTAAKYPNKFAAIVTIAGGIVPPKDLVMMLPQIRLAAPPDMLKLYDAQDPYSAFAKQIGKTPTWIFHGTDDNIVPASESRKMAEALKTVKGEVRFTEYAREGHNIDPKALADAELWKWLLAQRLGK